MFATVGIVNALVRDTPSESELVSTQDSGPVGARQLGEPRAGRALGEPSQENTGPPDALAFAEPAEAIDPASSSAEDDSVAGEEDQESTESTTTSTPDETSAPPAAPQASATIDARAANPRPTTSSPSSSSTTTPPVRRATTSTTQPRPAPTTTTPRRTTTTRPPTTTTTTTPPPPPTTAAPAPSPSSGPGCSGNCQTLGLLDLRNARNQTIENVIISNPNGRCVDLTGARDITLRNVTIRGCGTNSPLTQGYDAGLILLENASGIRIENSVIEDISAERFGHERNNAIQIRSSTNVTITGTTFQNVNSDIGNKSDDKGSRSIKIEGQSSSIRIDGNRFHDAGRNAVQITRVRNAAGISITNNQISGRGRWDSDYEDMINLFSSSGTASSPIRIAGNTLRNGGPSTSGTGIILGDGNQSSGPTQHVLVENNSFIDPGHVGINLAGGENITIRSNTIVARGDVPHQTTTGFTINHFGYSVECKNHVVTNNRVWVDNQHLSSGTNHTWIPGTCTNNVSVHGNIFGDESLR